MSETSQVLLIVGGVITAGVLLLVFGVVAFFGWRVLRDLATEVSSLRECNVEVAGTLVTIESRLGVLTNTFNGVLALPESLRAVSAEVKAAASGITELPKFVEGHQKVSIAMVAEILQLRKVISKLSTLLTGTNEMLETYDDHKIAKEINVQNLIQSNRLTREDALEMLEEGSNGN
jgi:hypothetical protein